MKNLRPTRRGALALCLCLALASSAASAADTWPAPAARDTLATARALIADGQWAAAITELQRVNDSGNADWNNLMGYSHRKARKPDHAAAERYYDEALRIDPRHRGALEYSGELYLALGDLARAEARLATLGRVCPRSCEELVALKQVIEAHKAQASRPQQTS